MPRGVIRGEADVWIVPPSMLVNMMGQLVNIVDQHGMLADRALSARNKPRLLMTSVGICDMVCTLTSTHHLPQLCFSVRVYMGARVTW